MDAEAAHRYCAHLTRAEAENFYYGIRLLPADKRRAMCAVYAFARQVDDIGDGSLPEPEKLRLLEAARAGLAELSTASADPVLAAVADARTRFPLPLESFTDLIDGVEMDVRGARYETFEDLVVYCRRVAGSIGRLCLAIFGAADLAAAAPLADDLGVAMQLTNILRDVREDLERGRTYLPAEDLRRFGLDGALDAAGPGAVAELVRFEAGRDREWFARGLDLVPMLDGRSGACVAAMTGIYRRVLDRIEERPEQVLRRRVSLPVWEKALVAGRSLAAGAVAGARAGGAGPAGMGTGARA